MIGKDKIFVVEPSRNEYGMYATKAKSVLSGMTRTKQDLRIEEND